MSDQLSPEELLREFGGQESSGGESQNDPEFDVRGKKYRASQIEEFKNGYMKDADYRQKTQELSEQRRAMAAQEQELTQYRQAVAALQQRDPYFLAQAQRILQGQPAEDPYAQDPYMQAIRQQGQAIQGMFQMQQELATKQNLIDLENELTALEDRYPQMDRDKVVAAIAANPNVDTEEVARISHDEMNHRVKRSLEGMVEQRRAQKKALVEGIGGRTAGITKPSELPKNREEMEKAVAERLKQLGGF
jgi:hypothetical protein